VGQSGFVVNQRLDPSYGDFTIEQPVTALTGWPMNEQVAALAIWNGSKDRFVHLHQLSVLPIIGPQNLASMIQLRSYTAASGETVISPQSYDSAASAPPSQVEALYAPYTATAGAAIWKRIPCEPGANLTRLLASLCARLWGDSSKGVDNSEVCKLTGDADLQKIVLREGEGVGLQMTAASPPCALLATIVFRVVSTSASYRVNQVIRPRFDAGETVMTLMNNSGSGVVIEVCRVQIRESGTDDLLLCSWEPIDGMNLDFGDPASVVGMDSRNVLPAEIKVRSSALVYKAGTKYGATLTLPFERRQPQVVPPWNLSAVTAPLHNRHGWLAPDLETQGGQGQILRPSQGYALFLRNLSALFYHQIFLHFEVGNDTPPNAAGVTYVS
jgi:hypothetical protein